MCCPPYCAPPGPGLFPNYVPFQVGPVSPQFPGVNVPQVSVTVCSPQSASCQTIDHILVDTGSMGLRIFKQALSIALPTDRGQPLAECVSFGTGNAWGSVNVANVEMAGEPRVLVPIQVIDPTYGTATLPAPCNANLLATPQSNSANGILGLAPVESDDPFTQYYTCQSGSCTSVTMPNGTTVQNPVYLLPQDSNGIFILLKSIPSAGVQSVSGSVILGIGTEPVNGGKANNDPNFVSSGSPYVTYNGSSFEFFTTYKGLEYSSIVDSGTNMMVFQDESITRCQALFIETDLYCPNPSPAALSAIPKDMSTGHVTYFSIADADVLGHSGNSAFNDLGSHTYLNWFVWGFPFFFGKSVFITYTRSQFGPAPQWGYAILPP
ncbi:MAG TPA: DUF3443 family protein [Candidatus Cybelea sp.]|jgi:hypothetical protein|nr:DUF3443 family protein [Candidatus Cybelea sp.]